MKNDKKLGSPKRMKLINSNSTIRKTLNKMKTCELDNLSPRMDNKTVFNCVNGAIKTKIEGISLVECRDANHGSNGRVVDARDGNGIGHRVTREDLQKPSLSAKCSNLMDAYRSFRHVEFILSRNLVKLNVYLTRDDLPSVESSRESSGE